MSAIFTMNSKRKSVQFQDIFIRKTFISIAINHSFENFELDLYIFKIKSLSLRAFLIKKIELIS